MQQINFDLGIDRTDAEAMKYDISRCPKDVLPFWVMDTDFPCPIEVNEAISERIKHNHYGYAAIKDDFSQAVYRWYKVRHNVTLNKNLIGYAPSIIPGMIWAIKEYSSIGDKVLIQTPVYKPFHEIIKNTGRQIVCNEMIIQNNRYEINFNDLEEKLKDTKVKIMIICNPQNPTGRNFSLSELTKIGDLCTKYNKFVIVDEIHADYVFDNKPFISFSSIKDDFKRNSITFINPGKTFNVAGFLTAAWFTFDESIYNKICHQQEYARLADRPIFGTLVLETCYNKCDYYADQVRDYTNEVRDVCINFINENIPQIRVYDTEATFVLWLDFRNLGFKTQSELSNFLINDAKVLLSNGTSFGEQSGFGFMRFNFGCPKNVALAGLKRIKNAIDHLNA